VHAVIAESYERIHRSNLVGMGILPLQYEAGSSAAALGLTGEETFAIRGLAGIAPHARIEVEAARAEGTVVRFKTLARVDDPTDVEYMRNDGILPMVLRDYLR
jgi:aconitate hydratase